MYSDGESFCKADGCRYDREILTPERILHVRIVFKVLVYAGMFHSLLIYWFPRLQIFCLFQVMFFQTVIQCMPQPQLQFNQVLAIYSLVNYMVFYEDKYWQNYVLIGHLIPILFVLMPVLYQIEMNVSYVFGIIVITVLFGMFILLTSMGFMYIVDLHQELHTTNTENVKLLDGMHEGLVILSKTNHDVMFCNKPAKSLIKTFLTEPEAPKNSFLNS